MVSSRLIQFLLHSLSGRHLDASDLALKDKATARPSMRVIVEHPHAIDIINTESHTYLLDQYG